VEPCVIHIRPGANSNNLKKEITDGLSGSHGFINLDVNSLIRDETERKTSIGNEMLSMVQSNRIIPAEMMVRMLKKIIYCGQEQLNKFILQSFPDIVEQSVEFETNCSKIKKLIYSSENTGNNIEIKNNNISLFNLDTLFQKDFRLKTMYQWDFSEFEKLMGNATNYGIVLGQSLSGKTEVGNIMNNIMGYKVIDMNVIKKKAAETLAEIQETDAENVEVSIESIYAKIE
jgi:RNA processing factor Prp31